MARGKRIYRAEGAGRWFPMNPDRLRSDVAGYIEDATPPPVAGRIVSAIAPHAGYMYSGKTAGHTFRAIRDNARAAREPETVVILGFSHSRGFGGVALLDADAISTPLGETALDADAANVLIDTSPVFQLNSAPHRSEHSAENEAPFVQHSLPNARSGEAS